MKNVLGPWALRLVVLACAACGESGAAVPSQAQADGGTGDAAASGAYTLSTCTTNIAADVPAFYRDYFRCVSISATADGVAIQSNGLPPHLSYYYGAGHANYAPFDTTRGAAYRANPNKIVAKTVTISVPDAPASRGLTITAAMVDRTANTNANEYRGGPVGVAIDSVWLFNDQAAPRDDIDDERFTFDDYEAHPAPDGSYHYHASSKGPLEVLLALGQTAVATPGQASVELYGIMCDGTVVLGCKELDGSAFDAAALDAQNGHLGDLKGKSGTVYFTNRYHTHVCPTLTAHKYMPEIQYYGTCSIK